MIAVWILAGVVLIFGLTVVFGAPYVPTRKRWAEAALTLTEIEPDDVVVDLGSGDGTILKLVAKRGARVIGYEINPILVCVSRLRLWRYRHRTSVRMTNYWHVDLPAETTVVYIFALKRDMRKLSKYLDKQAKQVQSKHLHIITFGCAIPDRQPLRKNRSANLYEF